MNITKKYSNTYRVIHAIANKPFMPFGEFMGTRKRMGLSTERWEKCFACNHGFTEEEDVYIGTVSQKGNIFFCKSCVEKYNTEIEKEVE